MKRIVVVLLMIVGFTTVTSAQLRKVPAVVTDAFKAKFANATSVEWKDKLTNFEAGFSQNGVSKSAKFTKEGTWLETSTDMAYIDLYTAIQDGFDKSKYAEWEVVAVTTVEESGKAILYKIYVKKNDIQKRNLFFDKYGRLIKDSITI